MFSLFKLQSLYRKSILSMLTIFSREMAALSSVGILLNILKCFLSFYTVYYVVASVCYGAYRFHDLRILAKMPFDFNTWIDWEGCCSRFPPQKIANLICMESTYLVATFVFVPILRHRVWDYGLTITLLHVLLSSAVMTSFPLNWMWWCSLALGVIIMLSIGEMLVVCCDKSKVKVEPTSGIVITPS